MTLEDKITAARSLISRVLDGHTNPVAMSSFGKDSMVMLDILKRMQHKLPILFHREPFYPKKYEFSNRIIQENDYAVYDYAPLSTGFIENNGHTEIANFYQVRTRYAYLPTGIRKPRNGEPFLCAYQDLYLKPTGTFEFPWDLVLIGHKSSDVDPVLGPVPLSMDVLEVPDACTYAFPLRYFTDADVWEYHREFGVPINEKRYDPENGYRECSDITFNNDYHPACTLCMETDGPAMVLCPKVQAEIPNISSEVRHIKVELPMYLRTA